MECVYLGGVALCLAGLGDGQLLDGFLVCLPVHRGACTSKNRRCEQLLDFIANSVATNLGVSGSTLAREPASSALSSSRFRFTPLASLSESNSEALDLCNAITNM